MRTILARDRTRPARWRAACGPGSIPPSTERAGLNSPAGQYNYLQGGNAALAPETAKTYTVGLVMTPWTHFSATVDYWHIDLKDKIGNIPPA